MKTHPSSSACRICFVVDYRSPHARNWIAHFLERGYDVHVLSTFPSDTDRRLGSFQVLPLVIGRLQSKQTLRKYFASTEGNARPEARARTLQLVGRRVAWATVGFRRWFHVFDGLRIAPVLKQAIDAIAPDIVHAMRIPYEAMIAAHALRDCSVPLVVSVWGQDFVMYAAQSVLLGTMTKRTMRRVDGLHADCARDITLAQAFKFSARKPHIVLPSGGGIERDAYFPDRPSEDVYARYNLSPSQRIVFNPRNFRPLYVRTEEFFDAIALVQHEYKDVIFVCAGMEGNPVAIQLREKVPVPSNIRLLPFLNRMQMAELFRIAALSVSPSINDGTPNSLLEAMACGALPIAGDIEPIREWIEHGKNGLLCDPYSPSSIARAIEEGLSNAALREQAAQLNDELINLRAERRQVMAAAERFYSQVIAQTVS